MGAVVLRDFRAVVPLLLVAVSVSHPARGEDLAMPYACSVERGAVRLEPAAETTYAVLGKRFEQKFAWCPAGPSVACHQLLLHRFHIACGGEKVAWARVAAAAPTVGIHLPHGLPADFAPVTILGGRFLLPALPHSTALISRVSMQELSPDSVIEPAEAAEDATASPWAPVVKADMRLETGAGALRVAAAIVALLTAMLAASMVAAGRWRISALERAELLTTVTQMWCVFCVWCSRISDQLRQRASEAFAAFASGEPGEHDTSLTNAAAMAKARLAETEFIIAALPGDLLLREVLGSELERVRQRLNVLERDIGRSPPERSASIIRSALRDLDRIGRIAASAGKAPGGGAHADGGDMPRSVGEAYLVLGLNSNAPAEVAKRLVDALRMSWHPDHARDDLDRGRREARIKQINAAWDIVNGRREAA